MPKGYPIRLICFVISPTHLYGLGLDKLLSLGDVESGIGENGSRGKSLRMSVPNQDGWSAHHHE